MNADIIARGRVAVVTGAANGIGAAAARRFAREGMRLVLFDRDEDALRMLAGTLDTEIVVVPGDVSREADLEALRDAAYGRFGEVALLMNNAAIIERAGPYEKIGAWRHALDINFFGVLAAQHLFVPRMIEAKTRSAIVNLGSKEGITTPPGKAAYSVSKAAVKVLTEQLSHELLKAAEGRVTAHLLVPGYTWTPMNFPGLKPLQDVKPEEPWTAEQVIDLFVERFRRGDFYIICPDNSVTSEMDARRIRWAADDMVQNRPALSRWHPDWGPRFAAWMSGLPEAD
jgi:NAD(P)-dependent dehydrogenase (short-subunit alcohol dehydrogenase family)